MDTGRSEDLERMIREQIERRGLHDPRLLAALRAVPRHWFVPAHLQEYAYDDGPLPIGLHQTISQPYIVAYMTHRLVLTGREKVLEIGTGSGYQAAVLANLAGEVHSVEALPALARQAAETLRPLGLVNLHLHTGDGSLGWLEAAPFDAILVTAAAPGIPPPLVDQLVEGGRMVLPVGRRGGQVLCSGVKIRGEMEWEEDFSVSFVLLRGAYGWGEEK